MDDEISKKHSVDLLAKAVHIVVENAIYRTDGDEWNGDADVVFRYKRKFLENRSFFK